MPVRLERDSLRPRNKYGRSLAYVLRDDGFFLDAELVKQGYAHAIVQIPHPRMRKFRALERAGRAQRRGLWAEGDDRASERPRRQPAGLGR